MNRIIFYKGYLIHTAKIPNNKTTCELKGLPTLWLGLGNSHKNSTLLPESRQVFNAKKAINVIIQGNKKNADNFWLVRLEGKNGGHN